MCIQSNLQAQRRCEGPASVPPSSRLGSCGSGRPGTLTAVGNSCGSICFWWMLTSWI
ncbi:unnamed protein product [Brassica oleracea var. botrytis]